MVVVPLPPVIELERLLSALLDRTVRVAKGGDAPARPAAVARWATAEPVLELVALVDLPLAAAAAAALSLVAADKVPAAVESGGLDPSLRENLAEVMNVVTRYVSGAGCAFRLRECTSLPDALPEALVAAGQGSDEKRAMAVEVAGYGGGCLAFCTL